MCAAPVGAALYYRRAPTKETQECMLRRGRCLGLRPVRCMKFIGRLFLTMNRYIYHYNVAACSGISLCYWPFGLIY